MDFSKLSVISIPRVDSNWTRTDYLGALKVRLSIGRNSYEVKPGLYKFGNPGKESEVIVTSNYKLTFDIVRRSLLGIDTWILVLNTFGVNVWCAAGKGTFGTQELIKQIKESRLQNYVSHKRVIVPQLGAPGVSGFKVKEATGFKVNFGPIRAEDIKTYISDKYKKSQKMRSVKFNFIDRVILSPVELAGSLRYLIYAILAMVLISGIYTGGFSLTYMWQVGIRSTLFLLLAYFSGAVLGPALLPWIPIKHFGGKGLIIGFLTFTFVILFSYPEYSITYLLGWLLISGAISSFMTMNFTGASTYTSLSGVQKEMRIFVPIQIAFVLIGLTLIILSNFF